MKVLDRVPTKSMPDWKAIAELAAEHGAVLLPLAGIPDPHTAQVILHRCGMGFYRAKDVTGEHIAWRVAPLSRKNKRKASEELV